MFFMGITVFFNVSGRPSVQAYRAVDILSLISVGMMFGVAVTSTAFIFRGNRVR